MSNGFERLARLPKSSFFLFGARGIGKSTWVRTALPNARRFDLLDEGLHHSLIADPSLFAGELRTLPSGSWVVVDEVQRIPSLLNEVHRMIEERRLRFALLGSSSRKLKTAGTNLLAGRAVWKLMYPFVPAELGSAFDLNRALRFGTIPLVWTATNPADTLSAYVRLYLREEIRGEALVRSLPSFVRFLPIAALSHAQVVNVSGLARDSGVARNTVDGYLEILEDTLLAARLPAYEARIRVRERKHPKLYWLDPGLVRAVKNQLGPVAAEETGALFEGWVLTVLRAHGEEGKLFDELAYWAPLQAGGVEVDFLLTRGRELLALEVKSQRRFTPQLTVGLKAIADLPKLVRRILLYRGDRVLKMPDGIEVWPVEHFLATLAEGKLWP